METLRNYKNFQIPCELEEYFQNKFSSDTKNEILSEDESCIKFWEDCIQTKELSAFEVLRNFYPQLNFPIQTGIDKTENYTDAVLKGKDSYKNVKNQLQLNNSEGIKIKIHESIAGKIPILSINDDADFVSIVQSFLYKNNPIDIPQSMGAFLTKGINNWERIHSQKKRWSENNPFENWNTEFSKNILPNPDLYKDKIIVLSSKPYSNISSEKLNLSDKEWKAYSYVIRFEHECTHLYTLKKYGKASNNLHDELIADYIGISKALGSYNRDWMLLFMGLEDYPKYRKGARLQNYLADLLLSEVSFKKLTDIIKDAIETIDKFDQHLGKIESDKDQICRIETLCETGLLQIASKKGLSILMEKYNEKVLKNGD